MFSGDRRGDIERLRQAGNRHTSDHCVTIHRRIDFQLTFGASRDHRDITRVVEVEILSETVVEVLGVGDIIRLSKGNFGGNPDRVEQGLCIVGPDTCRTGADAAGKGSTGNRLPIG